MPNRREFLVTAAGVAAAGATASLSLSVQAREQDILPTMPPPLPRSTATACG